MYSKSFYFILNTSIVFIIGLVVICLSDISKIDKLNIEIQQLQNTIKEQEKQKIIEVNTKFDLTNAEYLKYSLKDITVTSYNNHANQTDNTPNITATNRPVREGIVAASPDLISKGIIKYGDLVYIDCFDKWYVAEDTMNKKFERRLDIFLFDKDESLKINKKCGVEIIHYTK